MTSGQPQWRGKRQTFQYEGVVVLEVISGRWACDEGVWSGLCQTLSEMVETWEGEMVDKVMPTLADAYEKDSHPRKKFMFRRLVLRITYTKIDITERYFSAVLCVQTEREGRVLSSRTLPAVYAPDGKALPLFAFCSPSEYKALAHSHHIRPRKLRYAPFYVEKGKAVLFV